MTIVTPPAVVACRWLLTARQGRLPRGWAPAAGSASGRAVRATTVARMTPDSTTAATHRSRTGSASSATWPTSKRAESQRALDRQEAAEQAHRRELDDLLLSTSPVDGGWEMAGRCTAPQGRECECGERHRPPQCVGDRHAHAGGPRSGLRGVDRVQCDEVGRALGRASLLPTSRRWQGGDRRAAAQPRTRVRVDGAAPRSRRGELIRTWRKPAGNAEGRAAEADARTLQDEHEHQPDHVNPAAMQNSNARCGSLGNATAAAWLVGGRTPLITLSTKISRPHLASHRDE